MTIDGVLVGAYKFCLLESRYLGTICIGLTWWAFACSSWKRVFNGVSEDNVKVDGSRLDRKILHYDYLKEKLIASLVVKANIVVFSGFVFPKLTLIRWSS